MSATTKKLCPKCECEMREVQTILTPAKKFKCPKCFAIVWDDLLVSKHDIFDFSRMRFLHPKP
ncbi:MAG TPA: hypothetical protein VN516_03525 [Candidatus Baltobacteraceae bacterium]|nr:hypothetical protein [Candidatus Baltobacteraceae bacterium]